MTVSDQRVFTWKFTQLVWLLFGLLEALIGLRVILRLIAANPNNPFAQLIYNMSYPFVWPFLGLTRTPAANGSVFEISSIIGMFVYALVGWVIVQLVWIFIDRPRTATMVRDTTVVQSTPTQPVLVQPTLPVMAQPTATRTVTTQTVTTQPPTTPRA